MVKKPIIVMMAMQLAQGHSGMTMQYRDHKGGGKNDASRIGNKFSDPHRFRNEQVGPGEKDKQWQAQQQIYDENPPVVIGM